jgi:ATP-dependent DNA helicase RecG
MTETITEILKEGESEKVEFKVSFGKETIESLCAFANSKGGSVFIGIDDKGRIKGVESNQESIQNWINQIKNSTYPSIIPDSEEYILEGKTIVTLSIISYPVKPVSFKGKYYKRKHNSNHLMDLAEIANEHLKTVNLSWDFAIDPRHGIEDISQDKVNIFIEKLNKLREFPIDDDPLIVLKKFELLRQGAVSFGCFLLFSKKESMITTIEAGRFDSETIIKDNKTIRGDLFSEIEDCIQFY